MESKFTLIDGEFSIKEAREVIENLLDFKIQFHGKKSFGSEIRTGSKDERSLVRKESLKKTKVEFLTYLEGFQDTDVIRLYSEIQITK